MIHNDLVSDELEAINTAFASERLDDLAAAAVQAERRLSDNIARLDAITFTAINLGLPFESDNAALIRDALVFVRCHSLMGTLGSRLGRVDPAG